MIVTNTRKLREDVEFLNEDGVVWACDTLTGFEFALRDVPESEASGETIEFASLPETAWELLGRAAFFDESRDEEEILRQQSEFMSFAQPGERLFAVRDLLGFVRKNVPYYRARSADYDPNRIHTLADFASRVAIQEKADLRLNFDDLISEDIEVAKRLKDKTLELAATSGTTGERLQVLADMTVDSVPQDYESIWSLHGKGEDYVHRTAVFTAPVCLGRECRLGKSSYEERVRGDTTLYLNSTGDLFSLRKDLATNIIDELNRFNPDLMLVNPVYLHWLLRCADQWGLKMPKVQAVLSCYQYLSEVQRRAIEKQLGAPVYNYYFATDLAGSRLGVDSRCGHMHVREDHAYIEVVDEEGAPKADGEIGALVCTAHANRVMPMIRYRVGDVGRLTTTEGDDCAIAHWQGLELHGRAKDMLFLRDRWWTTRQLDEVVSAIDGIAVYKLYQDAADRLRLEVIPSVDDSFVAATAEQTLREALGVEHVRCDVMKRLEAEVSMKFRMTQCTYREAPLSP